MRLRTCKNLEQFLNILFSFFKNNSIQSSLHPVQCHEDLLDMLLNSKFIQFKKKGPAEFIVDFKLNRPIDRDYVYYFIFGNDNNTEESGSLLIDLSGKSVSFICFTCCCTEDDFSIRDIIPDTVEEEQKDNITFDKFIGFLNRNSLQKILNFIEVE
jgi:hypothetical protein